MDPEQDDKISQTESTSSILNASIAKVTYYTITNTIPSPLSKDYIPLY